MVYLLVGIFSFIYLIMITSCTYFLQVKLCFPFSFPFIGAAVLLKKFAGEGERVDVQKLFGYIGLFTLVALWWPSKCCGIVKLLFDGHRCL